MSDSLEDDLKVIGTSAGAGPAAPCYNFNSNAGNHSQQQQSQNIQSQNIIKSNALALSSYAATITTAATSSSSLASSSTSLGFVDENMFIENLNHNADAHNKTVETLVGKQSDM